MNRWFLLVLCYTLVVMHSPIHSDETPDFAQATIKQLQPFTGRITRQNVRLRLNASIDGPIIDELDRGDLFLITGEKNDFYTVAPPSGFKAYIFRTFVLDGVVEGSRVNVRIEPHLDSPILAQLNTGDLVAGSISERNSKWLEIDPPESVYFYIAKEYIERAGDPDYLLKMEKRHDELTSRLTKSIQSGEEELKKTFAHIELDPTLFELKSIIDQYPDFPTEVKKVKKALASLHERYLERKLAYYEAQLEQSNTAWESESKALKKEVENHLDELANLEERIRTPVIQDNPSTTPISNERWESLEKAEFEKWAESQEESPVTIEDFYLSEEKRSKKVHGTVEPYIRHVKNKPGNFRLISPYNQLPIGFLYSTFFDLNKFAGTDITLVVVERNNHNFAYPAYFVIDIE